MDGYNEMKFERVKPLLGVLFIQTAYAGMDVLSKVALNQGMSVYVFVFYCNAVAFTVTLPFAIFVEKNVRPKMTFPTFIKIVALGLLEPVITRNFYFSGMKYTTATYAVAMANILPATTFIMACILKLEKIKYRSIHGQAKVVGTLVSITGALIMTLIKGPALKLFGTHHDDSNSHDMHVDGGLNVHQAVKGSVMILIGCICWSCFIILQSITLEAYRAELSLSALMCLSATTGAGILALVMERGNPMAWSLNWDSKLLVVAYSGLVCSGMVYYVQGIVMKYRGPVFVTSFEPLCMVFVAILGSIFLAEQLTLGRSIGAIVIIIGLYLVVWGQSKDYKLPCTIIKKENTVLAKQTADESNTKEEHSNHKVITICNSGVGEEV